MFGWFRKNEKQMTPERAREVYELGRQTFQRADADIEAFMARYDRMIGNVDYLVFGQAEQPEHPDVPPIVVARADLKLFLEHLDEYLQPIDSQLDAAMVEWAEIAKQAGVTTEFERLIQHHLDQFKSKLVRAAFQCLLDKVDTLKQADERWRAANPEKAAQIPFDTFGSELADLLRPFIKL